MMEKSKLNVQVLSPREQEERIEKLKRQVRADKEIDALLCASSNYELVFNNSYISLLNYIEDKKMCQGCQGFSHCSKIGQKGLRIKLSNNYYSNSLETHYVPCNFYRGILKLFDNIIYSDIDKWRIYHHANEGRDIIKAKLSKVKDSFLYTASLCLAKVKQYNKDDMNKGYMISSDNHNGEAISYLVAYAFARNDKTVSIVDAKITLNQCSSLIEDLKKEGEKNLELAKSADAMIITNLGFEYKSQAARDLILTPLLMDRAMRGKITFISSYLDYNDVLATYSKDRVSLKIFKQIIDKIVDPIAVKDLEYFND